jgi:hypothetical protein
MGGSGMGTIVTCGQPELQFRSGQHWGIGVISPGGDKGVLAKTENSNQAEGTNQIDSEDEITLEEQLQEEEQTAKKENSNIVGRWGIR